MGFGKITKAVKKAVNKTTSAVSKAYDQAEGVVSSVASPIVNTVNTVAKQTEAAVKTAYNQAEGVVSTAYDQTERAVSKAYDQAEGVVSTARDQTLAELDRAGILSRPQAPNMTEAAVYKAGEAGEEAATIDIKKKKLTKKTGTTTTAQLSVENIGTAIQQRIGV